MKVLVDLDNDDVLVFDQKMIKEIIGVNGWEFICGTFGVSVDVKNIGLVFNKKTIMINIQKEIK